METIHRFTARNILTQSLLRSSRNPRRRRPPPPATTAITSKSAVVHGCRATPWRPSSTTSRVRVSAGWFFTKPAEIEIEIVKAGDPVLHEPAGEVPVEEIGSQRVQRIIDDMIRTMRKGPGVGLAAPQIGIPLKIIVLEDTKEYIGYAPRKDIEAQDRRPFELLVIVNPILNKKSNKTALFFEGCLRLQSVLNYCEVVHFDIDINNIHKKSTTSGTSKHIK